MTPHPFASACPPDPPPPGSRIPLGTRATIPHCPEPPRPQPPLGLLTPNLCSLVSIPAPGMLQGLPPAQP